LSPCLLVSRSPHLFAIKPNLSANSRQLGRAPLVELGVERVKRHAVGQTLGNHAQQEEIARSQRRIGEACLALVDAFARAL
jgi:hypothetical protein